jgi:hypothetical protein
MKPTLLEREEAIAAVRAAVAAGRHLLVHGAAGIGKSALLQAAQETAGGGPARRLLYCAGATPAAMLRQALAAVHGGGDTGALPAGRCRYLLRAALAARPCCLVWDPLPFVARAAAHGLRDLLRPTGTPLLAAARSPHMEDIGALATFFALRQERLALRPLSPTAARRLAEAEAARLRLQFPRPQQVLEELLGFAKGNPGEILAMLALARQPCYRGGGGEPKLRLIYLDRLTGGRGRPAEKTHAG